VCGKNTGCANFARTIPSSAAGTVGQKHYSDARACNGRNQPGADARTGSHSPDGAGVCRSRDSPSCELLRRNPGVPAPALCQDGGAGAAGHPCAAGVRRCRAGVHGVRSHHRGAGARVPGNRAERCRAQWAVHKPHPELRLRRAQTALPPRACLRQGARRMGAYRTGLWFGRCSPTHHRTPRGRCLHPQRLQELHYARWGRLDRRRNGADRSSAGSAWHLGFRAGEGHARFQCRQEGEQARHARQRYNHVAAGQRARAGGKPHRHRR
jgi:hypothetical protein